MHDETAISYPLIINHYKTMARVKQNALTRGLSGTIGGLVFRQVGDETIVSAAEAKGERAPRSARQQAHLNRFHLAQRYAAAQVLDPAAKALYATGIDARRLSAYHVAIADYMHAPQILGVDRSSYHGRLGDLLRITATDDFAVTAVLVRLETADGALLEAGSATPLPNQRDWLYTAQTGGYAATLHVQASDRPGNVTTLTLAL